MRIRADKLIPHVLALGELEWTPSPMPGVDRRMLDREGDEVAVATSIVRYGPGSSFSAHTHGGGEELLVLDGIFSDERGDYPAGTYVRNPVGSRHTPFTEGGCVLLVKLWQMPTYDARVVVREAMPEQGRRVLHEDPRRGVKVFTARIPAGRSESVEHLEALVLSGCGSCAGQDFEGPTWIRIPVGSPRELVAGTELQIWAKTGHLSHPVHVGVG